MKLELSDGQKIAINQLKNGSILCGGVGSGKSRTALSYYFFKVCQGTLSEDKLDPKIENKVNLVIITTAKKRDSLEWNKELIPFGLSTKEELDLVGVKIEVDSWNNIAKYKDIVDSFFIFDEQRLVGSGVWVKSFLKIAQHNQWILLSATPGDTWLDYIPVFIANGFYKNRTAFMREHVVYNMYSRYPKIDRYIGCKKLVNLKNQIIVDLDYVRPTETHWVMVKCEYDEELYSVAADDRWNPFTEKPIQDASGYCQVLRRITNQAESRIEQARKIIKENQKLIIFYTYNYELEILRKLCEECEVNYSEWNGHNHQKISESIPWVYLVQYTAGAEGWNCIETNVILFYSLDPSYKRMIQAAGRIDRMNTPFKDLYYYGLVSDSSIDKRLIKILKNKERFNEEDFYNGL